MQDLVADPGVVGLRPARGALETGDGALQKTPAIDMNKSNLVYVLYCNTYLVEMAQLCTTKAQEMEGFRRLKWAQKKAELCVPRMGWFSF